MLKIIWKIVLGLVSLAIIIPFLSLLIVLIFNVATTGEVWTLLGYFVLFMFPIQIVTFLINVFKNVTLNKEQKFLWAILIIFLGYLSSFFYWYRHIWKNRNVQNNKIESVDIGNNIIGQPRKTTKILWFVFISVPYFFGFTALLLALSTTPTVPSAFVLGIFAFISGFLLMIFCIINVYKNKSVKKNTTILWTVLLVFGNLLIFYVYWYFHIWREPKTLNGSLNPTLTH